MSKIFLLCHISASRNNFKPKYSPSPDDDVFRHLARTYSYYHKTMHYGHGCDGTRNKFTDGITNGARWYPVKGGHFNHVLSTVYRHAIFFFFFLFFFFLSLAGHFKLLAGRLTGFNYGSSLDNVKFCWTSPASLANFAYSDSFNSFSGKRNVINFTY